ncbi:MutL family mismatch-repair protein Pms1 [Schizosaccharomyces cryophilus OY26]|uniref:DNA mismatch repair protein PMS1 n=1 Tax=Schizosaccharomyces cryophilus (strain OY26 / ATCC MYA-4695 / CBS 11777 / NBRC 106824 / NRRL Y48691) TaxID=653667 RepID=S9XCB3_SCHCR|nr:MutL family mismatch-repair protein Pms1 [Schizosaccharomyces cryophilus OY26]EPY51471.1 MutL family mismatch-repair protein Pms1 [Schizosaccharomyces cryophilus OY26]
MSIIRPITNETVHRICSGQVITDLASAVKELVENSLDSGATTIEVRFKNYGLDSIEVLDNGSGISIEDQDSIGKKHYTSKIEAFRDLDTLQTFGFRGEALSSLCSVSNVTITTATSSEAPKGFQLKLDHEGTVISKSTVASQKGTMVSINDLFSTLPVRRKVFERNCRRDFSKSISLLQAYAVISTEKKFIIFHQTKGSGKVVQLSTNMNSDMKMNIMNIFGTKISTNLIRWKDGFIDGYISRPHVGSVRLSSDKQMLFINGRPIHLPKLVKTIQETFKIYSLSQAPFFAINLTLTEGTVDVNVSPDKRSVFLSEESYIIDFVRESLQRLCEGTAHSLTESKVQPSSTTSSSSPYELHSASFSQPNDSSQQQSLATIDFTNDDDLIDPHTSDNSYPRNKRKLSISGKTAESDSGSAPSLNKAFMHKHKSRPGAVDDNLESRFSASHEKMRQRLSAFVSNSTSNQPQTAENLPLSPSSAKSTASDSLKSTPSNEFESSLSPFQRSFPKSSSVVDERLFSSSSPIEANEKPFSSPIPSKTVALQKHKYFLGKPNDNLKKIKENFEVSFDELEKNLTYNDDISKEPAKLGLIHDISDANQEEHLNLIIHKTDFLKMRIVGQFNRGFIVVTHENNLFIIDQHASDEKFNYEKLKDRIKLKPQELVAPKQLNLAATEEIVLFEHMGMIREKGFELLVDMDQPVGKRCKLVAVPSGKNVVFDVGDLLEMLNLLSEHPRINPISSKLERMLASKACRSSIMIGRALTISEMTTVVRHLAELSKPWNCPHGRPTMRHLFRMKKSNS